MDRKTGPIEPVENESVVVAKVGQKGRRFLTHFRQSGSMGSEVFDPLSTKWVNGVGGF